MANTNLPPNKPVITSPSNDEVVPLVSDGSGHEVFTIEWTCSDPDNDELTYYVSTGRTQSSLEASENIETLADSMSLYFNDPNHDYTGIWYTRVLATDGQDTVSSDVVRFELDWPTVIQNIEGTGVDYRIYPNPTDDNLTIEFSTIPKKYAIEFYNSLGQRVLHKQSIDQIEVLDLEKFPGGIYYLKLYNKEFSQTERIVVR